MTLKRARRPLLAIVGSLLLLATLSPAAHAELPSMAWSRLIHGAPFMPRAYLGFGATVVDKLGHTYVVGCANDRMLIVRYGIDGRVEWQVEGGPFTGCPGRIAIDAAGDVFVAGSSRSNPDDQFFQLAKYDGDSGVQLWASTHAEPGHVHGDPTALVVDRFGDPTLAAATWATNGAAKAVTVRFSGKDGRRIWAHAAEGSALAWPGPRLAVDSGGNALVARNVQFTNAPLDFVTAKLDRRTGAVIWETRYDGAASLDDEVLDLAVDPQDHALIAAYEKAAPHNNKVFLFRKLDGGSGALQWSSTYDDSAGAIKDLHDIVVDERGDLLASGGVGPSSSRNPWLAIKFRGRDGAQQWAARFDQLSSVARPWQAAAVLPGGDLLITGTVDQAEGDRLLTARIGGQDGLLRWTSSPTHAPGDEESIGSGVAVHRDGSVAVVGAIDVSSGNDTWSVSKLEAISGSSLWTQLNPPIAAPVSSTGRRAMVVDASGRTAFTGGGQGECLTTLVTADGALQWSASYRFSQSQTSRCRAAVFDPQGNVIAVGDAGGVTHAVKYDADSGQALWTSSYFRVDFGSIFPAAVAVDGHGDLLIAGHSYRPGIPIFALRDRYDLSVVKFRGSDGELLWEHHYDSPGGQSDLAHAIAIDGYGDLFVTGQSGGYTHHFNGSIVDPYDYVTLRLDGRTGNRLWLVRYDGPAARSDVATDIALDAIGNVIVTGSSEGTGNGSDYATLKYNGNSGNLIWQARYDGPEQGNDLASALALDSRGQVVVTGTSAGALPGSADVATVKYDGGSGAQLWVNRHVGIAGGDDRADSVAIDGQDQVYVAGWSQVAPGLARLLAQKIDGSSGEPIGEVQAMRQSGLAQAAMVRIAPDQSLRLGGIALSPSNLPGLGIVRVDQGVDRILRDGFE